MCSGCPIPQQWPLSSCLFIQKINLVELSVSYSVSLSYVLNWGCLSPDGRLPSVSSVPKAIHEGHANNGVWIYCKSQECWWPRLQSSCDTPWNLFTPPEILGRTRGQENASNRYFFQYEGLDYLHYPCIGSCEKCLIANTGNCSAVQSLMYSLSRHDYQEFMWSYISKLMSWLLACLPNLFKNVSSVFELFCLHPTNLQYEMTTFVASILPAGIQEDIAMDGHVLVYNNHLPSSATYQTEEIPL